ncbi:MAG: SGNH/GDSL hydrolase family protein [Phycisphaerae bacterium]
MLAGGVFGYLADYALWWVLYLSLLVHTWCFFRFFPRRKRRKLGLAMGNGLVFICMLGFAALAAESYFRFVCVETDPFGWSLPAQRWFALHARLNSLGCRDVEWSVKKPSGVRRIAFVGDSFTYGWGIEDVGNRFSDRVGAMFDRASPGTVQVMNVAKAGWDTGAQLQPIKDMIAIYGVDEVVLCYVANDIEELLPKTDDFNPVHPPQRRWFNPDSSCLVDYLYRRIWMPRAPTVRGYHDWLAEGFADSEVRRRHCDQLGAIIRHCRDQGVTIRAVLLPFILTRGEKFQPTSVHAMLRRFFEAGQVAVLDLLPTIAGEDPADLVVNGHDAHPNEQANELFAEAIWNAFYATAAP